MHDDQKKIKKIKNIFFYNLLNRCNWASKLSCLFSSIVTFCSFYWKSMLFHSHSVFQCVYVYYLITKNNDDVVQTNCIKPDYHWYIRSTTSSLLLVRLFACLFSSFKLIYWAKLIFIFVFVVVVVLFLFCSLFSQQS